MALRRGLSQGRLIRGPRRKNSWAAGIGGDAAQTQITGAGSTIVTSAVTGGDGVTLVRTRGQLLLFCRTADAALAGFTGAFGIAVATTAAIVAGAAAVPTPISEQGWDGWLYWHAIQLISAGVVDGTAVLDELQPNVMSFAQRIEIDSKAMRKIKEDESIYAVLEVQEDGASIMNWYVDTRMLFKLP